jgi:PKD repeat protein
VGWSPDGGQLAYDCLVDASNADICAIGADGTGFVRLTDDPAIDNHPAFSPDGETIAFSTDRYGGQQIATMTSAGGGVTPVGLAWGFWPSWTPDGSRLVHVLEGYYCEPGSPGCISVYDSLRIVNANGSGSEVFREVGSHPAWTGWTQPLRPIASFGYPWCDDLDCQFDGTASQDPDGTVVGHAWDFGDGTTGSGATAGHTYAAEGTYGVTLTVTDDDGLTGTQVRQVTITIHPPVPPVAVLNVNCAELVCTFNGSLSWDSDGTIVAHAWNFGDGATASGATASHTYAASGTYTVTLTVTDDDGLTDTETMALTVTQPPIAVLTVSCAQVVCTFNGSTSWDPDGTIVAHAWNFGDGATASGATAMHTYAASGTYTVTLTVTDDDGLTDTETMALAVTTTQSHVGDLDGTSTQGQGTWTATVTATVHDTIEASLANAVLTAYWSVGGTSSSCTTDVAGRCTVARSFPNSTKTVTLSIGSVTHSTKTYVPSQNHDPDGDSTGTSIVLRRN